MTVVTGRFAQLAVNSNLVENVIVMESSFQLDGYYFQELDNGQSCQPGAYYNKADGKYYIDSAFTTLVADQTSDEITLAQQPAD